MFVVPENMRLFCGKSYPIVGEAFRGYKGRIFQATLWLNTQNLLGIPTFRAAMFSPRLSLNCLLIEQ
jgi:hypothetical protein